ncbi:hypothetical protein [Pseudosporangium ferrugineum]|uniref:Uncharacterized protein n=1 Tax=Pseudosporangium ferrugineum TaxID=439699 RepID=A0A2T0RIV4_9ACTN|nr:hypothetical protein [Pseudosporangium ferrugineum]PRY21030.1 hypothetical protein CLV70_12131 [Pseudosporangium ferrugineum]
MKITSFDPRKHGYHFANRFVTHVAPGIVTRGLCGGMSMGALDHWRNGIAAPNHFATAEHGNDLGGAEVPAEGGRLQSAIYERQVHSLTTALVYNRWLFGPGSVADGHRASVGAEFTEIRRRIDAGRPCLVGLWSLGQNDVFGGHQVLCYGYETTPMKLYVYDPNHPDQECELRPFDVPDRGVEVCAPGISDGYRGWFAADVYNWDEQPPWTPRYVDLAITEGIRINGSTDVAAGGGLEVTATIKNMGQYPSRFKNLYVYVRDPKGFNADHLLHGAEPGVTMLQPGESHTIVRRSDTFAAGAPGNYRVGVSYLSLTDRWCDLSAVPGTRSFVDVAVHPPNAQLVHDRWVEVPESATEPVGAGVTIKPGDQIALTGRGAIWAGVWFTGNNGPEGWVDWITDNPRFPLHGRPDARQFSLIFRVGDEAWTYAGPEVPRRTYGGAGGDLQLWINDDVHNNGTGAFNCRVQVWR